MNKLSDVMNVFFAKTMCLRLDGSFRFGRKDPVTLDSDLIKEIRNHTGDNGRCSFVSSGHEYIVQSAKVESSEGRIQSDWIRLYAVVGDLEIGIASAHCYHDRGDVWMATAA